MRWAHFKQDWFIYDMPSELAIWGLSTAFVNFTDLIPITGGLSAPGHSKADQTPRWLLGDFLARYSRVWIQFVLALVGIVGFGLAMYWGGLAHACHAHGTSHPLLVLLYLALAYIAAAGSMAIGILSLEVRT